MWFRVRVSHPISHSTHWSFHQVICKKSLFPPSLGQWPPIRSKCGLGWIDHNHCVMWLIDHVIMLYSQKGASPFSQCQWPLNLIRLWVRLKKSHLLFQVTFRSIYDHALFGKYHASTNARSQNSAGDIKHRKIHKSKSFFVIQKILTFHSHHFNDT